MRRIQERSKRHELDDLDKLYSSDVSALKKLQMTENNQERFIRNQALQTTESPRKDENFAGRNDKRKNLKKPTASEQRSIQKLFRRKQAREAAQYNDQLKLEATFASEMVKINEEQYADFNDGAQEIMRSTDIRKDMQIRMNEFENRSSRFAKIHQIKSKLPFLQDS